MHSVTPSPLGEGKGWGRIIVLEFVIASQCQGRVISLYLLLILTAYDSPKEQGVVDNLFNILTHVINIVFKFVSPAEALATACRL